MTAPVDGSPSAVEATTPPDANSAVVPEPPANGHGHHSKGAEIKLALAALGVVYGDIGTSPLYAVKECFTAPHGVAAIHENVLGILSLIVWSLLMIVAVKYLTFVMRADNKGEGGILALLSLVRPDTGKPMTMAQKSSPIVLLGLFGSALLYGDGIITPAISVLSAVEGLSITTDAFEPLVLPITVVILIALFLMQRRGTETVGKVFGPVTLVWFITIAVIGAPWILRRPDVLWALDPRHALMFFGNNGTHGLLVLGSVVLCVTGGEALYADMGHFGRGPIRLAWYVIAFPALLLNYFGQGALLLTHGAQVTHPFYELVHGWVRYPVIVIGTAAAVVASQALISGAYSLTRQAIQLGYCPRLTVVHTSVETEGQIYMPHVNNALMLACLLLVFFFRSSTALAATYGVAVTCTMTITTVLLYALIRKRGEWSAFNAALLLIVFLAVDLVFLAGNVSKIPDGGWVPISIAGSIFVLMTTWKRGRAALAASLAASAMPLDGFLKDWAVQHTTRVSGTGVFMASNATMVSPVLLHHFKHTHVLHEEVVLLSVATEDVPEVPEVDRVTTVDLGSGFYRVTARYGFMESPNVPRVLERCRLSGLPFSRTDLSYYLGRETLLTTGKSGLAGWRKAIFWTMSRNAQNATAFFKLPPDQVVEVGTQVEI